MRLPRIEPETKFLLLAAAVGAAGALLDAGLRALIELTHGLFARGTGTLVAPLELDARRLLLILPPMLGGLCVGLLGKFSRTDVGGYALPTFLEKVNLERGELQLRGTLLRALAAALTLGSGGSAGVEGPIATLGGGIAGWMGKVQRLAGERLRVMIACGSSAAVAAAYGAPIAGVFFTQEIVLAGNYDLQNFVRVVVASGSATVVARAIRGDAPMYAVEPFRLVSATELVFYLALGLACGLVGALFSRAFFWSKRRFARSSVPALWRPALGGALVGLLAIALPDVLGTGHTLIGGLLARQAIAFDWVLASLGALVVAKLVATSITIGSGGAGGIFGPSLCLGALLGALVGGLADHWWHASTSVPGHYAMVGMGALLAATVRAPLTSVFLVFEMTGSSSTAVLPTIVAVAASLAVARKLERHSIDETELARRGVRLKDGRELAALRGVTAAEAMNPGFEAVPASASAPQLQALVSSSRSHAFVVVDESERMLGLISLQDLRILDSNTAASLGSLTIASDLCERQVVTIFEDEPLSKALTLLDRHGFRQLPVVERADPRRVKGMLERHHILTAYRRQLLDPASSARLAAPNDAADGTRAS
ncbi:MAG: chloride channel protein [Planctomycetes bacterium]|nr:chloride channel protein [Planctomycetota bacterium]